MNLSRSLDWVLFGVVVTLATSCVGPIPSVSIFRAPEGASLPQVVVDEMDTLHLVYYTGSMSSGDLFYVTRLLDGGTWSVPQRVNSRPHSVTGLGPIDGGQLAIGPDGLLHITWFHRDPARFYYTKSDFAGGFEQQQTLSVKDEGGVEAGSTLAVDPGGNVYVFWHADPLPDAKRRVYMVVSRDNGKSFDLPRAISPPAQGACGCCGLRAASDEMGAVYLSYRSAGGNVRRGMRLLTSVDQGHRFTDKLIHAWEIGACPVATTTLDTGPNGVVVAWETEGEVYLANTSRLAQPVSPSGVAGFRRKNATVSVNNDGDKLLAWGDGPGWQSGGTLHWQLFDEADHPRGAEGTTPAPIPARSVPSVAALSDGSFVVVY